MPTITRHKPLSIYSNPNITKYEFGAQDSPLLALKVFGVCILIVMAVLAVVMGVAVYRGARQMNGVWGDHSNMVVTYRDEESTRQAQQARSETHRSYLPSPSSNFTLDTPPSNPVIECRGGKC